MFDKIVDWFGIDFKIECKDEKMLITVKVSHDTFEYRAMQYLINVKILLI